MARVAAWVLNEGSGTTAAEVGGNSALALSLVGCTLGATGIDFSGSTTDYAQIAAANNSALRIPAPFSLACRVAIGASPASQQFIHSTDAPSAGGGYSGYNLHTNSSSVLEFMYGDNGGAATADRRSFLGPTLAAGTTYDIVVVCTDTSGGTSGVTIYVNGSPVTLTTNGDGGAMAYSNHPTTFGRWIRNSRNSAHVMRYFAIYDHALTQEDVTALVTDYTAFITQAATSSFSHSGSGGVTAGGAATTSYVAGGASPGVFSFSGSGGVQAGGAAEAKRVFAFAGTGGFSVGSQASLLQVHHVASEGGIVAGGAASVTLAQQGVTVFTATPAEGGLSSSGAAGVSRTFLSVVSGGLLAAGAALVSSTVQSTSSASIILRRRRRYG